MPAGQSVSKNGLTINPFEAVNRKNNFLEALDSENGGNWRVSGKGIMLCLAVVEPQCRKGH